MNSVFITIPVALFIGLIFLGAFWWAWRSGQFDNIEAPSERMIHQDDDEGNE